MIIHRIVHGYVIQKFDTELHQWISQEFVEGTQDWEDWKTPNGTPCNQPVDVPQLDILLEQP